MEVWREMFFSRGAEPIPMPNTGFMIFRNWCHRDRAEEIIDRIEYELKNIGSYLGRNLRVNVWRIKEIYYGERLTCF